MDEKTNIIDIKERLQEQGHRAKNKPAQAPKIVAPKFTNPIKRNFIGFLSANIKAKFKLEDLFR